MDGQPKAISKSTAIKEAAADVVQRPPFIAWFEAHPAFPLADPPHEFVTELAAHSMYCLASRRSVQRWEVVFRWRTHLQACTQQWQSICTEIGLKQRRTLIGRGGLCEALVLRLVCVQDDCSLRCMLHLAKCIISRRHFLGSKKCLAQCLYEDGLLLYEKKQFSSAAKSLGQAALLQHPGSHAILSDMLIDSSKGLAMDEKLAFELASAGAVLGCARSQGLLGYLLAHGFGIAQDVTKGFAVITGCLNSSIMQHEFDVVHFLTEKIQQNPEKWENLLATLESLPATPAHVHELFSNLISISVKRIQWPANCDTWTQDCVEQDTFSHSRLEIANLLDDSTRVLKGDGAMGVIWPTLSQVLTTPAAFPWRQVEALLFVATCLIHRAEGTWQPLMFSVVQNVQAIASMTPKCVSALLGLFCTDEAISHFNRTEFAFHAPACVSAVFSFIQNTLATNPEQFQFHSTQALLNLAFHCPTHLAAQIELLVSQAASSGAQSLTFVSSAARKNFMDAFCCIAAALPVEIAVQAQMNICLPAVSDLQKMLAQPGELEDNASPVRGRQRCVHTSARLTSFYQALELQVADHASKLDFQSRIFASTQAHLWPVLRDVLWRCARDDFVTEEVIKTLKHWVRSCGTASAPILPELCQLLSQCLRRAGLSGSVFVWVAVSVVGLFGSLPEHAPVVDQLQQVMVSTVFELLATGLPAMEQHADMTLEVLDLLSRSLKKFPHLPQQPTFQVALQFAMVSLTSRDERILDGVFFFIDTCLTTPSIAPTFVQHYGRQVLTEVIPRIKGVYPKKMMRQLAPVIQKLFAQDMEGMPNVVMDLLLQWPADSIPTMDDRTDFFKAMKYSSAAAGCGALHTFRSACGY